MYMTQAKHIDTVYKNLEDELTDKEKSVAKKLEDKYGAGTLSLETGEIQPLP